MKLSPRSSWLALTLVSALAIVTGILALRSFAQHSLAPKQLDIEHNELAASHMHSTTSVGQSATKMIDGAQTPDLIPDLTAYLLVLTNISEENPTSEQADRQLAFLRTAGLDGEDIEAALPLLATFKSQFADLIASYNKSVDAANALGVAPDLNTFLRQRDALVQSTLDALSVALTPDALSRFRAYVKSEKAKMKVPAKEVQ